VQADNGKAIASVTISVFEIRGIIFSFERFIALTNMNRP
jgi:hypothetical protein